VKTKYKTCPRCGAHLDYGERCDCTDRGAAERENTRATAPARAKSYVIGVDLAKGKEHTAKAYISRA